MKRFGPILREAFVIAMFLLTAYTGIVDGIDSTRGASGLAQRLAGVSQLLYGGLAAAALLARIPAKRWILSLVIAWGVALSVTGGVAAVVWGEQSAAVGVFAALCTAGVAALVFWACRSHNRNEAERGRARMEAG